jgi:hypothetical protein
MPPEMDILQVGGVMRGDIYEDNVRSLSLWVLCISGMTIATHIDQVHDSLMHRYIIVGHKNSNNGNVFYF